MPHFCFSSGNLCKATEAVRAALPIPTSGCSTDFAYPSNGTAGCQWLGRTPSTGLRHPSSGGRSVPENDARCACLGFLMCPQMLMHTLAHGGLTNTVKESALKADKHHSNPDPGPSAYQRIAWPLDPACPLQIHKDFGLSVSWSHHQLILECPHDIPIRT